MNLNIKKIIKNNWQVILLVFFCVLMFYPYTYLSFQAEHKFYTPDETANYIFTKSFTENNQLFLNEKLNINISNLIHPRSVNVLNDKLIPESFLGIMVIYGFLGKIFGLSSLLFFTSILSLLIVIIFYFLIKEIFSKNIAFWSALLILINPIFWYYAGRAMMHTNLFIFFLVLGLFLLVKSCKVYKVVKFIKLKYILISLSAISLGLALLIRASELVFMGIILLCFVIFLRKKFKIKKTTTFIIFFISTLSLQLFLNYKTYGSLFSVGYSNLDSSQQAVKTGILKQVWNLISLIVLPFGFKLKNIWLHLNEFLIKYLWFYFLPAFLSLIHVWKNFKQKNNLQKFYITSTTLTFIYSIIFYGSYWPWGLSGQFTEPEVLIGGPHFRYWLPVLILLTPLIVLFFLKVFKKIIEKINSKQLTILLVLFVIFNLNLSYNLVYKNPNEGFYKIKSDLQDFKPRLDIVKSLIKEDSILVVPHWADRIFFPEFKVIHSLEDQTAHAKNIFQNLKKLTEKEMVYYYSASSKTDIDNLNNKFKNQNLELIKLQEIYKGESLYIISPF